jgi:hypothetical protein
MASATAYRAVVATDIVAVAFGESALDQRHDIVVA